MITTARTQRIEVSAVDASISVINAGPQGPPGPQGEVGPAGLSGDESIDLHLMDPTPHPVYDDMVSLSSLLANALA